jgi:endonuclease-8
MPEAPEVYNYYQYIYPKLKNKILFSLNILSGKYTKKQPENFDKINLPSKILNVNLHGKLIFIELENNITIEFSHGMTGFWSTKKEKHSRVELVLNDSTLYFEDSRNFARLYIYNQNEYKLKLETLGPRVLDVENETNFKLFLEKIKKKKNSKIGLLLLDQSILSGVGNYLRCDVLWYTKIHHNTKVKDLSEQQLYNLFYNCIQISRFHANLSCKLSCYPINSTFVYMQDTDIYGNKVIREKFGSRTIHFIFLRMPPKY